jgi:hypothetical protein
MIKVILLITVIVLLTIAIFYFNREHYAPVCNEFKNIQVVLHTLDIVPKIGNVELKNYVSEQFASKLIISNLNNVFRPLKVSFNLLEIVEEESAKNLRLHYDNYPNIPRELPKLDTPKTKNYDNLFSQILKFSKEEVKQKELEEAISNVRLPKENQSIQDIPTDQVLPDPVPTTTAFPPEMIQRLEKLKEKLQPPENLNQDNQVEETETEDSGIDSDTVKNMMLKRMPPTQRFLYDNKLMVLYPPISQSKLNIKHIRQALETGAKNLELSLDILNTYGIIPSNFQAYFNLLKFPNEYGIRLKFMRAVVNYDPSKYVFEPVVVFKNYFTFFPKPFPWFTPDWEGPFAGLEEGSYNYDDVKKINSNVDATASFLVKDGYKLQIFLGNTTSATKYYYDFPPGRYTCPPWLGFLAAFFNDPEWIHNFCRNKFNAFKVVKMGINDSISQMEEELKESEMILAENVVTKLQLKIEEAIEKEKEKQMLKQTTSALVTEKVLQSVTTQIAVPENEIEEKEKVIVTMPGKIEKDVKSTSIEVKEVDNKMLDEFVKTDLEILENQLKSNLNNHKTKIIVNLLLNIFDETKYDDKNMHIYLMPFLPNNEKFMVIEGHNKKPLILISLYNVSGTNVTRNIQTYDTSNLGCNYLSEYITNSLQLKKFEQKLDELINGNKSEIKRLKKQREELQTEINRLQNENPDMESILRRYNCIQNDLIELYSKDYMDSVEVRKLKRFRMKGNYKALVKDEIKKVQDKDNIKIKELTKESNELKITIDKSNKSVTPLLDQLKNIDNQLTRLYSGEENSEKIEMYRKSIGLLKSKINKVSSIMQDLSTSIILTKSFAILNGLNNFKRTNDTFNVIENIQNNGLVMDENVKQLLTENIRNDKFNTYSNDNNLNYFIPKVTFIKKKCDLLVDTPINNLNNRENCDNSVLYYYDSIPKLEIYEQITILRSVIENQSKYYYLNDIDVDYLKKLLEFLERTYFGKEYKTEEDEDVSSDKLQKKYFLDNIFQKNEALKILESIIIEIYEKTGSLDVDTKIAEEYRRLFYKKGKYYKEEQEKNKLSPTKRVYKQVQEAINCPQTPQRNYLRNDNNTLDEYMMAPINNNENCHLNSYINSFNNSFI